MPVGIANLWDYSLSYVKVCCCYPMGSVDFFTKPITAVQQALERDTRQRATDAIARRDPAVRINESAPTRCMRERVGRSIGAK
jgi:hypothetical protein